MDLRRSSSWGVLNVLVLSGAFALEAACSSASPASAVPAAPKGDASYSLPQGPDDGGNVFADGAPPLQAFVRIAHTSPDAAPFDVCLAPHGTPAFEGPILAQFAADFTSAGASVGDAAAGGDAGAVGVAFSQVSAYVPIAPGLYDVRLVAAGAPSCLGSSPPDASPIEAGDSDVVGEDGGSSVALPDDVTLPPLVANTFSTLLIAGDLHPAGDDAPLTVTLLPDDAELAGGAASLRAINAVPSAVTLDFGLGSGAGWMPLLTQVAFAHASATTGPGQGSVDGDGYVSIPTFSAQTMSACESSSSDAAAGLAVDTNVDIELGAIATVIAIGGKTGDSAHPPALLVCIDNQPSGGLLSDCSVGP